RNIAPSARESAMFSASVKSATPRSQPMSAPAQKASPSLARTTARVAGSIFSTNAVSSATSAPSNAFLRSGRARVRRATCVGVVSKRTLLITRTLDARRIRRRDIYEPGGQSVPVPSSQRPIALALRRRLVRPARRVIRAVLRQAAIPLDADGSRTVVGRAQRNGHLPLRPVPVHPPEPRVQHAGGVRGADDPARADPRGRARACARGCRRRAPRDDRDLPDGAAHPKHRAHRAGRKARAADRDADARDARTDRRGYEVRRRLSARRSTRSPAPTLRAWP